MGYDIVYEGQVELDKELDQETFELLVGLSKTRRVAYNVNKLIADGLGTKETLGIQGEFFVKGNLGSYRKEYADYVIDVNIPPYTQPELWCTWTVAQDKKHLIWTRREKSYAGHEWLSYIVKKILVPRGYIANGIINWHCQRTGKHHTKINNNSIRKYRGFSTKQKPADFGQWYQELSDNYKKEHEKWIEKFNSEPVEFLHYNEYLNSFSFNVFLKENNLITQVTLDKENNFKKVKILYDLNSDKNDLRGEIIENDSKNKELFHQIFNLIQEFKEKNPNWEVEPTAG